METKLQLLKNFLATHMLDLKQTRSTINIPDPKKGLEDPPPHSKSRQTLDPLKVWVECRVLKLIHEGARVHSESTKKLLSNKKNDLLLHFFHCFL